MPTGSRWPPAYPTAPAAAALRDAVGMPLTGRPGSPEASAFVSSITDLAFPRPPLKRPDRAGTKRHLAYADAVAAITHDLLAAWGRSTPSLAFHAVTKAAFTGEPVSYRAFVAAIAGLKAAGLIHGHRGIRFPAGNGFAGKAACFAPAQPLLEAAEAAGLTPDNLRHHFRHVFPTAAVPVTTPLLIRGRWSKAELRRPPECEPDYQDAEAARLRDQVVAFNAFALGFRFTGCRPPQWLRRFTGGLRDHGRWYAAGSANYQGLAARDRLCIRINDQPVAEIDVAASSLTLLHGLHGLPRPPGDLYELPGLPRDVVKQAVVRSIGNGRLLRAWDAATLAKVPDCREHAATAVAAALAERFPFLKDLPSLPHDMGASERSTKGALNAYLMGLEARIVTDTMESARRLGVLAMPIHDGLIVPSDAAGTVAEAFTEAFRQHAGVTPLLKVIHPPAANLSGALPAAAAE